MKIENRIAMIEKIPRIRAVDANPKNMEEDCKKWLQGYYISEEIQDGDSCEICGHVFFDNMEPDDQ